MQNEVDSYKIGAIQVVITETDDPGRLHVDCNDGNYHSGFTVSTYEYKNYKRHMNQKISQAFKRAGETNDDQNQ